jgi:hypothetical protein
MYASLLSRPSLIIPIITTRPPSPRTSRHSLDSVITSLAKFSFPLPPGPAKWHAISGQRGQILTADRAHE